MASELTEEEMRLNDVFYLLVFFFSGFSFSEVIYNSCHMTSMTLKTNFIFTF